jgi:hypothetical protein
MAKIKISSQLSSEIAIPPPNFITIFADAGDLNRPKYKTPDGVTHDFGGGGAGGGGEEWRSSVKTVSIDPTVLSPVTGDRYLIGDGAIGVWAGKDGQIAQYGIVSYIFVEPSDGMTIKADDDDTALYHHEGDYVSGVFGWDRQPFTNDLMGLPTDGTWDDGLFDFENTLIIDAIDALNEVALALAPPPAPALSDWNENTMTPKANGAVSFDTANPIGGYTPADGVGVPSPASIDVAFNTNMKRLGITNAIGGTNLGGVLNYQVPADTGTPNPAYPAGSFGSGNMGFLKLYINGVLNISLDLTNLAPQDSTFGGTISGLNISASFPSLFPLGNPFQGFQNRTGTWKVLKSDLQNGYNHIIVVHEVTPSNIITLDRIDLIADDSIANTLLSAVVFNTLVMSGSKKISGVDYHTGGTAKYSVNIDNAYRNTWSKSAMAISHQGVNCSAADEALTNSVGDEAKQVNISAKTTTITPVGIRILNSFINLKTTVLRTVQGTIQGGLGTINSILLDNILSSSTVLTDNFDDEEYRLPSNTNFDNFASFLVGSWDGEQSIKDGAAGYTAGLQVIGGSLIYPGNVPSFPADFRTSNIVNGSVWNDGGTKGSDRNYSGLTGNRTYYRFFRQVAPTVSNFNMLINGSGGTFVPKGTALTGNNIHVEMRAPTQTGWMDCYNDFSTGLVADGDGSRNSTAGNGRAFGTPWGLTIGTKSTALTGGYMVVKITVGNSFIGQFTDITFNFG